MNVHMVHHHRFGARRSGTVSRRRQREAKPALWRAEAPPTTSLRFDPSLRTAAQLMGDRQADH